MQGALSGADVRWRTDPLTGKQGTARVRRLAVLAGLAATCCLAVAPGCDAAALARASAAKTIVLKDTAHLHRTGGVGLKIYESGYASGTVTGPLSLEIQVVSSGHAQGTVSIHPHGGSITATGVASYRVKGTVASFSGSLTITAASGSYRHVRGSHISFAGQITAGSNSTSVSVQGKLTS